VRAVAARWRGGWGGEFDQLGLEACRSPEGEHCMMLGGGELGCPDGSGRTRLGGWFAGWYVFALDARQPRDLVCAGTGYGSNADLPLWPLGPTVVRSGVLGRLHGRRPVVDFFAHARLSRGRLDVARVRCTPQCRVGYEASDPETGSPIVDTEVNGTKTLGVDPSGLREGKLTVTMHIDDSPVIKGSTRFSK
jgi:hypothetical protein